MKIKDSDSEKSKSAHLEEEERKDRREGFYAGFINIASWCLGTNRDKYVPDAHIFTLSFLVRDSV